MDSLSTEGRGKPLVVFIQGAPGSGKTTLARRLADALALPILSRDTFWEIAMDTLRPASLDESERLGHIPFELYLLVVRELLGAGVSLIAEANFHHGRAEERLRPLLPICHAALVHCRIDWVTGMSRWVERFERGERHWSFFDAERLRRLRSGHSHVDRSWYEPLELKVPTLIVDTSAGYDPGLEAIVAFVRSASRVG